MQGIDMQNKIKALAYRECSAKTGEGIDEVFAVTARHAMIVEETSARQKSPSAMLPQPSAGSRERKSLLRGMFKPKTKRPP